MNGHAARSTLVGLALFLFCAVSTGCDGRLTAQASTTQTHYIVFVDRSLSPGQEQVALWATAAEKRVFQRLQPGDAVTAYEISDRTADTAPLIDIAIPRSDDVGMEETLRIRRILANARSEGWRR